jgi:hypothetical protein
MSLAADTLGIFLAFVLLIATAHKLLEPARYGASAAQLIGAPMSTGMLAARAAGVVEGLAALALLMEATRQAGAIIAAALWLIYSLAVWRAAARGALFDCGCTLVGRARKPSGLSPLSPLFLAFGAVVLAVAPGEAGLMAEAPFAAVAFLCLRFAAEEIALSFRQKEQSAR